mmetsp:Transcript_1315/g.3319  ORF Transcript_1315/g.3319 Transcript_1315/m.3319 type:complete len:289 (+) Transcript_1315:189-1055(+)
MLYQREHQLRDHRPVQHGAARPLRPGGAAAAAARRAAHCDGDPAVRCHARDAGDAGAGAGDHDRAGRPQGGQGHGDYHPGLQELRGQTEQRRVSSGLSLRGVPPPLRHQARGAPGHAVRGAARAGRAARAPRGDGAPAGQRRRGRTCGYDQRGAAGAEGAARGALARLLRRGGAAERAGEVRQRHQRAAGAGPRPGRHCEEPAGGLRGAQRAPLRAAGHAAGHAGARRAPRRAERAERAERGRPRAVSQAAGHLPGPGPGRRGGAVGPAHHHQHGAGGDQEPARQHGE